MRLKLGRNHRNFANSTNNDIAFGAVRRVLVGIEDELARLGLIPSVRLPCGVHEAAAADDGRFSGIILRAT